MIVLAIQALSAKSAGFAPVLVLTAVLFVWASLVTPADWRLAVSLLLAVTLASLGVIDSLVYRLPDALTLPLILAGLMVAFALPGVPVSEHLFGAALGFLFPWLLSRVYRLWRGVEGFGLGDAKLLAAGGAWLGWAPLPSVLLVACGLAFAWISVMAVRRRRVDPSTRIAFGAPLSLAIWIVWLHGPLALGR